MALCKNCNTEGSGKYCSTCGQEYLVKRITLNSIVHEVVHTFSHFDKGFLYSIKELAIHPGKMQRSYLQGNRTKNQKPFAMFFFCATIYGLAMYFILKPLATMEGNVNEEAKMHFYWHYFVFLQTALIPIYSMVFWLLFRSNKFNYAESLVCVLYSLCFLLLLLIPINMVNLIPGHVNERWIELPAVSLYLIIMNLNLFPGQNRWIVIVKTIVLMASVELISNTIMNLLVDLKTFN